MTRTSRRRILTLSGALLAGSLAGCMNGDGGGRNGNNTTTTNDTNGDNGSTTPPPTTTDDVPSPELDLVTNPDVDLETLKGVIMGNTGFAFNIYGSLSGDSNLVLSPYSISVALAMTWAGARGETRQQMSETMRYTVGEDLHAGFKALSDELEQRDMEKGTESEDEKTKKFELSIANSVWGLAEYPYRDEYLSLVEQNYGSKLREVNFRTNPEGSREEINSWVGDETNGKIKDLLPPNSISRLTRLVLTNAIYLNANWAKPFPEESTAESEFTALDGSTTQVQMMRHETNFPYAEVDNHQVIELPYVGGDVGMVVVLPEEGSFEEFEKNFDARQLYEMTDALEQREGTIKLPKFRYESSFSLKNALSELGMPIAFDRKSANFGGMANLERTEGNLYISDVYHKTYIDVDEVGTEAAGATGVVINVESVPMNPFEMVVDRPFVFGIRDRRTQSVLFMGRVVDGEAMK
ncbi:MAG: serpin family protein [Halobacteria archaeon]|nr:serpin family protein [Halobacteria archaeon]